METRIKRAFERLMEAGVADPKDQVEFEAAARNALAAGDGRDAVFFSVDAGRAIRGTRFDALIQAWLQKPKTVDSLIEERALEIMEEGRALTFSQALGIVNKERPDLVKAHRAQQPIIHTETEITDLKEGTK